MLETRSVATVIGGSGFIGRYVVKRLAAMNYVVRVAGRVPERAALLRPMGNVGQIVPLFADLTQETTIARALEGATLAVNLVGILAERRRGEFDALQAEGAGRVARLAASSGVQRLVHVSAIGADPASRSGYGRSKARGEALVREHFARATILRPSIVFGAEDQFFNRFAALARMAPFMPVIAGSTRFQPVYVGDVADAVVAALQQPDAAGRIYELGGPRSLTFREILGWILAQTQRRRPLVPVPSPAARLLASIPFSGLTNDQLRMLQRDNVVGDGMPGLESLGIVPTPMELIVPTYLDRFRPGGRQRAG